MGWYIKNIEVIFMESEVEQDFLQMVQLICERNEMNMSEVGRFQYRFTLV